MSVRARIGCAVLCAAMLGASPARLAAQVVRGSVADSASGRAVSEFVAVLLDDRDQPVAGTVAGATGEFTIRAPRAGRYRLRVQRIGFRSVTSPPFDLTAGSTTVQRVVVASISTALAAVQVSAAKGECVIRPGMGDAAAVWEEVRKALYATQIVQSQRVLSMSVRDFSRDLELDARRVRAEESGERSGISANPYRSIPSEQLVRDGYVQRSDSSLWFYAPDASVLLSDDFTLGHCLRVESSPSNAGARDLIALAFEPVRSRQVSDIRGVLWVDRRSAALRALDFHYTDARLPPGAVDTTFGGRVEFQPVQGGAWLVRRWVVRAPIIGAAHHAKYQGGVGGRIGVITDTVITGIHDEGGEVLAAATADGKPLWSASLGSVAGVITDSATKAPRAQLAVWLRGSAHGATTDSAGRYRIAAVPPGDYTLLLSRSRRDSVRATPALAVVVRAGEATTADAEYSGRPRSLAGLSCADLRTALALDAETALAVPPAEWRPTADDSTHADAVRDAQVVVQVVVDTLGRADMSTFRAVRSASPMLTAVARRQVARRLFPAPQPMAGCRARSLTLVPLSYK